MRHRPRGGSSPGKHSRHHRSAERGQGSNADQAALAAPLPPAKHVFTHKVWELGGWKGTAKACELPDGYVWAAAEDLAEVYPVPNAFGAYVKAK